MKNLLRIPVVIIIYTTLMACGLNDGEGIDNGTVNINNRTERTIRVYYAEQERGSNGDVEVRQRVSEIPAGKNELITIKAFFWDGDFSAVYAGIVKTYDIDFNLLDHDNINIDSNDFLQQIAY